MGPSPARGEAVRAASLAPGCASFTWGARPNLVKTAPVVGELRVRLPEGRHVMVHTGQHYSRLMSEVFFEELGMPEPDHMLEVALGATRSRRRA